LRTGDYCWQTSYSEFEEAVKSLDSPEALLQDILFSHLNGGFLHPVPYSQTSNLDIYIRELDFLC